MKRYLKTGISAALAASLLFPAALPAHAAASFNDIENSFAKDAINELVEKGILNGKGEGTFDPTANIKRQDFAIILAKALNLDVSSAPATATFSDVPTDHYAYKYVEAAAKAGLISGMGGGNFGSGQNLTREQMATLFVRSLGVDVTGKADILRFSDADRISSWAQDAVGYAVELGLMNGAGNNTFNPQGNAEREQVALVASKFLKAAEPVIALTFSSSAASISTVQLSFSRELEALSADQVRVAVKATGESVSVSSAALSADKKSATLSLAELKPGTTYTVTYAAKTVEFTTPDAELELSPSSLTIGLGGRASFTAKLMFRIGSSEVQLDEPIQWSASSGTIDQSGNFTGNSAGSATITATSGKYQATATVTVNQPVYAPPVDLIPPVITESSSAEEGILFVGDTVYATSNESGAIYMIGLGLLEGTPTVSYFESLLTSAPNMAKKQLATAGTRVNFETDTLSAGSYYLFAVDASGNISESRTVDLTLDQTPPVISGVSHEQFFYFGNPIPVSLNESGTVYLLENDSSLLDSPTVTDLEAFITASRGIKQATVENAVSLNTSALSYNSANHWYAIIAVDDAGNVSSPILVSLYPDLV
ncbi:hypothetical protein D3P08_17425 [Paenibacillus nanensis]|uniref:SLH domain-containing protein n=1 Tax=Paenibacillus nanensis TaxID=393251 RepID=A0A3A1URR4_9BACL|nr:S-layer homology domain-containing protein [Paenibacillus nanensis]RIX51249.1 hypothetical protein D3P08_17425 [Paenibacillus nanensis]